MTQANQRESSRGGDQGFPLHVAPRPGQVEGQAASGPLGLRLPQGESRSALQSWPGRVGAETLSPAGPRKPVSAGIPGPPGQSSAQR